MTEDQKATALKDVKNAYGTLDLYESNKKDGKVSDFAHTALSLNAYAIASIAEIFGLQSRVKDTLDAQTKVNRERNEQIEELEQQLGSTFQPKLYTDKVSDSFQKIENRWMEEGFYGTYNQTITEYGDILISFHLRPPHHAYDLMDDDVESEEQLQTLFQQTLQAFNEKNLQTLNVSSYVHPVDCDANKKKIEMILKDLFPTLEIEQWNAQKQEGGIFTLTNVQARIKNLQFLEEVQ